VPRLHTSPGKGLLVATVLSLGGLGIARDARATLGGDVASVAANEQHLGGSRQVQKLPAGERHEIVLPSGIVVHEYVSPGGAVYAIVWRGPRIPDLRELLGPYFAQLASRDLQGGHHHMNVKGSDFMVRSMGHRNTFAGRAWVPSLVPTGVDVETALD
jgi:hypothetical protein